MNPTLKTGLVASPSVILNGSYGPDTTLTKLTPAQACLTALSAVMCSTNSKEKQRRDLKRNLDGIWLVTKGQISSMHLALQQKVATGFLDAFVHAFGGDKERVKRLGLFKHPTVISIVKTLGIQDGDETFTIGQVERQVGTSFVKLADGIAKEHFDPHATA